MCSRKRFGLDLSERSRGWLKDQSKTVLGWAQKWKFIVVLPRYLPVNRILHGRSLGVIGFARSLNNSPCVPGIDTLQSEVYHSKICTSRIMKEIDFVIKC